MCNLRDEGEKELKAGDVSGCCCRKGRGPNERMGASRGESCLQVAVECGEKGEGAGLAIA